MKSSSIGGMEFLMKDISEVDVNFKLKTDINKDDVKFYDANNAPFKIYGVFYEDGKFRRLPEKIAKTVSYGVDILHANTAGGRVRFKTNSSYVAIHVKMPDIGKMPHFALTGSSGFDLYVRLDGEERYMKSFVPPFDMEDGYDSIIELESEELKDITINFPLYSEVSELYIGLSESALVCAPDPYKIENPIVYYGSSITQGGCASRPGNSYESIVSRRFDANYINLGFSGSARAEDEIAEYIKTLDMSVFVYDYDHNAPNIEHLKNTHEKMFKTIRNANPDLPVIFMSRPEYYLTDEGRAAFQVIEATYNNAKSGGDNNVYFIAGQTLMELAGNEGTVDGAHPNDLGFTSMAKGVGDVLEKIL